MQRFLGMVKTCYEFAKKNIRTVVPVAFAVISVIAIIISVNCCDLTVAYTFSYGDSTLCVRDKVDFNAAKTIIKMSSATSEVENYIDEPVFVKTVAMRSQLDNVTSIADVIIENTDDIVVATILRVNGEFVACVEGETNLEEYLEKSRVRYEKAGTESTSEFVDKITTEKAYYPKTQVQSLEEIVKVIDSLKVKTTTKVSGKYNVAYGTTVVKDNSKAVGYRVVRTAGTYFDFWLTNTYDVYDAKVQNMEIATQAYSKDAQTMGVNMTVQYKIDTSKAIEIANQYGSMEILANRIESIATEKAKATLSSYSAMQIIETRSNISPTVEQIIKEAVNDEYCVDIVAVVLTNIDFSDAFEKTVEDKMIAEQEKLKAEYEKETAIVNAEKELEVAKLAAQAVLEQAKADAQAQIEAANAEAEAIRLKSIEVARALGFNITETTVTDDEGIESVKYEIDFTGKTDKEVELITEYLKYADYLAKWDGKLPSVMTGDSATIMIPTPDAD